MAFAGVIYHQVYDFVLCLPFFAMFPDQRLYLRSFAQGVKQSVRWRMYAAVAYAVLALGGVNVRPNVLGEPHVRHFKARVNSYEAMVMALFAVYILVRTVLTRRKALRHVLDRSGQDVADVPGEVALPDMLGMRDLRDRV